MDGMAAPGQCCAPCPRPCASNGSGWVRRRPRFKMPHNSCVRRCRWHSGWTAVAHTVEGVSTKPPRPHYSEEGVPAFSTRESMAISDRFTPKCLYPDKTAERNLAVDAFTVLTSWVSSDGESMPVCALTAISVATLRYEEIRSLAADWALLKGSISASRMLIWGCLCQMFD